MGVGIGVIAEAGTVAVAVVRRNGGMARIASRVIFMLWAEWIAGVRVAVKER